MMLKSKQNANIFTLFLTALILTFTLGTALAVLVHKAEAVDQPTVTVNPTSSNTDTITVTFDQAIPNGNIIDVELHDSNNQKIWQDFTSNGGTTFTTKASSSLNFGTYTIHVGLFMANWQNMYSWFANLGTITIGNNTNSFAPANQPSPTPTQAPVVQPFTTNSSLYSTALNAYNDWKSKYVTWANNGQRVVRPENNSDTVSEGMGYGMLLSSFAGDRSTFDNLWKYTQQYLDGKGLMNWQINSGGGVIGAGSATDADEDIAYALQLASKQWPGNGYDNAAKKMIQAIESSDVNGSNYITPGDGWGNTADMNPSYLAISDYRAFAKLTGDSRWNSIADTNMQYLSRASNQNTGLVPDWAKNDTTPTSDISWDQYPNGFYYDAVRAPIRMLWTYKSNNDGTAQNILQKESSFFGSIGTDKLTAGYSLTGSPLTNYQDVTFTSAYAAAGQINPNSSFGNSELQKLINTAPNGYFGTSLRAITLFISAGSGIY